MTEEVNTTVAAANHTLYVHNLNEKLKKDTLKKILYMLFSQYGKVVEIVACKGVKMRGQAWVIFGDVPSATKAMQGKQAFNFYGKPLKIEYAKDKSHVIARKEGLEVTKKPTHPKPSDRKKEIVAARSSNKRQREEDASEEAEEQERSRRLVINTTPHKILFAQNLPSEITQITLQSLFQPFQGFKEVRIVPGNRGLAFIEFDNEVQSGIALRQLHGFQLTTTATLHLTYSS